MFEPTADSTVAELEAEVKDLTDHLTQAREFIEFQLSYQASMAARYDKIIAEMRIEVDESNALIDANLAEWDATAALVWLTGWRKAIVFATYVLLVLVIVLMGVTR